MAHDDDPQAAVSPDDAALAAVIDEIVGKSEEIGASDRDALRTDFLLLESARLQRERRHAISEGDLSRQDELTKALQQVKDQMGTAMGQAT